MSKLFFFPSGNIEIFLLPLISISISKGILSSFIIPSYSGPIWPDIPLVNNGFAIVPDIASKSFSTFPNLNLLTLTKALVSDNPIDKYATISFLSGKSLGEKYPVNFILAV